MRVRLTPGLARKLLAEGSQVLVRHECLVWMADNFKLLENSVISLGEDGKLIDGYHRCTVTAVTGRTLVIDVQVQPYTLEL